MSAPPGGTSASSLVDLLCLQASEKPDHPAYIFLRDGEEDELRLSYGALDLQARSIANQLQQNARPGDRALLLYPAGIELIKALFGCLYAGIVAVPVPAPRPGRPAPRLQAVARDAQCALVLSSGAIKVQLDEDTLPAELASAGWLATDELALGAHGWQPPVLERETLAYLQYTSGSTSTPKGVMVSHGNLLHTLEDLDLGWQHDEASRMVSWLPHFHDMGLIYSLLQPLYKGFPCYFMAPAAFIQRPLRWLQAITRYRGTHSAGPNSAYELCVQRITPEQKETLDLSSWQVALNGSEPVDRATLERFAEAFEPCGFRAEAFCPGYGLAEATLKVSAVQRGERPRSYLLDAGALEQQRVVELDDAQAGLGRTLVGCGPALLDMRVEIVNPETGRRCGPAEIGEIWVSGSSVAQGYWGRPQETRETFRAQLEGAGAYLRTGDLGFLRGEELVITGRLKDLIIIRGRNHYPQDIERTVESSHPALCPGAGAAFSIEAEGAERLVVVQELRREQRRVEGAQVAQAMRQAVAAEHEIPIYALVLLRPGSVLKTSSGKIQRRACRAAYLSGELETIYSDVLEPEQQGGDTARLEQLAEQLRAASGEQPRLEALQQLLQALLGQRAAGAPLDGQRSLSTLGLDSLAAAELAHRLEQLLGSAIPIDQLLEARPAELAIRLGLPASRTRRAPAIQRLERAEPAPLSFEQERLWLLCQRQPDSPAYHIPAGWELRGALDLQALERALDALVARHEALRTSIGSAAGRPIQLVAPELQLGLPLLDLSQQPEADRADAARHALSEEIRRPFELERGPLLRPLLLRLGAEQHLLLLTLHHMIGDLWSMTTLTSELAALYSAFARGAAPALPPVATHYADFALWQRERAEQLLPGEMAYWQSQLASAPAPLELPADRPRPAQPSLAAGYTSFRLEPVLLEQLQALGRLEGATLFMTLLAAFQALLGRLSGEEDLLVGSPVAGRPLAQLAESVGFFAYPLPLRGDLSGDPSFQELLARTRRAALATYAHQEVPLSFLAPLLRASQTEGQLYRVMFGLLNRPLGHIELPELKAAPLQLGKQASDCDLFLTLIAQDQGLSGLLEYSSELFDPTTATLLCEAYLGLLQQVLAQPQRRLSQLALPAALAARARPRKQTIGVAASFTAEPLEESLAFWLRKLDTPGRIRFAPYDQLFQQLLDPASLLRGNRYGANLVLLRFEDWLPGLSGAPELARERPEQLERTLAEFVESLATAAEQSGVPWVVCLCPASPAVKAALPSLLEQLQTQLEQALSALRGVSLVTPQQVARLYPVAAMHAPYGDELARIPYTRAYFTALGTLASRRVHALSQPRRKVVVLDCDGVLWRGICGEDGPEGLELDQPRRALQSFMLAQQQAGLLLCLNSKNNEADVWEVFERRADFPLRREHLVAWRINWQAKSANLRSLARELNLGLESMIFIDDSPLECAEVQESCPEVLTLQLPQEPEKIVRLLEHTWAFDRGAATREDGQRTAMYQLNGQREQLREDSASLEEFIGRLNLRMQISRPDADQLARAAQLSQRTNQFNLTTIRYSEQALAQLCREGEREALVVELSDRFGDYGLVGLIVLEEREGALEAESFLLSCRVLGRGIEQRLLKHLRELTAERGLLELRLRYRPTAKNQPARAFLESAAASAQEPLDDGWRFRFAPLRAQAAQQQESAEMIGQRAENGREVDTIGMV